MSEIRECRACGKPFSVSEIGGQMPGSKESERIECPHCGDVTTENSNGVFTTAKLTTEGEEEWKRSKDQ